MLKGEYTLFVDQCYQIFAATTVRELREVVGGGAVNKMYVDGKDGKTYHVGYVIGQHWLTAYKPIRIEQ